MAQSALEILISATNNDAIAGITQVQDRLDSLQKFSSKMSAVGDRLSNVGQAMTRNVTLPIVAGLGAAGYAAVTFESQIADLNKAFGFDNGSQQAVEAQKVIMNLSKELRQMPGDVTAIATEAGKLGVQFNQLEDYTRTVTSAAVAFDMSAEQAGSSMAVLTNVLGYQDKQGRVNLEGLRSLGDAINYFADTGATSESAIASVLQRAGGSTRTFGLANESAVALSAAFLNLGYAPEVVGTAMSSMLPQLQNASQGTTKFKGALEQIGLPAAQFEQMVKKDATGAITTFLDAVKASGDTSIISRMFGTGSDSAMLASTLTNLDAFKKTLLDVENIPAGSMMETFAKRQQTSEAALEGIKASMTRLGISIGSVLLPALNDLVSAVTPAIEGFTEFAQANPGIVKIGLAIAGIVAVVGPALVVIGSIVSAIGAIAPAVAAVGAVIGGIAAGPVLIIIGIIAAIAAGAWLIMSNWGAISGFFAGVWGNVVASFGRAVAAVQQIGSAIASFATSAVAKIAQVGASAFRLVATFSQVGSQIMSVLSGIAGRAFAAGAQIVQRIAAGIMSGIGAVISAASSVASAVMSRLPNSPVPSGPLTALNNIANNPGAKIVQMISAGMQSQSVGPAIASAVSPVTSGLGISPTVGMGGGGGGSPITVNVTVNGAGSNAQEIGDSLEERLRSLLPRLLADNQRYQARVAYS